MVDIDVTDVLVIALAAGVIFTLGYRIGKNAGIKQRLKKGWN